MKKANKRSKFSLMVLLLIPVAIAINIVGGQLTSVLKLPLDMDTIGVILVGALVGPIPAAITGVLTNLINGIFDPTLIPYAICAFFIGLAAGLLAKYNMMTKVWKLIVSGIVLGLVGTITATPITVFFFGGASGGGASMIAAGLMATGQKILTSVLSVYIVTESAGKILSVFI
ncbi:MAG: ECF transporter S component, partial [Bifidobacteriales bacterium]|nr:ECF transporter S component [Bifidobacteriales bacterium]